MKRRARDVLTLIRVDRRAETPLRQQIVHLLRSSIRRGELPKGSRLPSSRLLASRLGISRNTVLEAYEELAADGFISARVGAGTCVCGEAGRRISISMDHIAIRILGRAS